MTVRNSKGLMFATLFACAGSAYAPVGVFGTLCVVGGAATVADGAINRRGWFRKIHCQKCGLHLSGAEHNHESSSGVSYGYAMPASNQAWIDPGCRSPDPRPSRDMCAVLDAIHASGSVHTYASYMPDRGLREVSRRYGY